MLLEESCLCGFLPTLLLAFDVANCLLTAAGLLVVVVLVC